MNGIVSNFLLKSSTIKFRGLNVKPDKFKINILTYNSTVCMYKL